MSRFEVGSTIFTDKDILSEDWIPEQLIGRDDELDTYAEVLNPVLNGWNPNNIFLYGRTGVGKSASTKEILTELLDACEKADISLNVVFLNCNGLSSSYQVAVHLVNEMRNSRYSLTTVTTELDPISETGLPKKRVFNELINDFENLSGNVICVLDEVDKVGSDDEILYELPRASTNYDLDVNISVIGISNDFKFRDGLSAKVRDSLCEEELFFDPYDATELQQILKQRTEKALKPDVLNDDVIPLCSAFAANDTGSARQAISLLRKACEIAERNNIDIVSETEVREAETQLQIEQVEEGMRSLTPQGKLILLTISILAVNDKLPARTKTIYNRYQTIADHHNKNALQRRRTHDHLEELTSQGILTLTDNNQGRGNYNTYTIDVELKSILSVLKTEQDYKEHIQRLTN